jgi:hypothetical protein
LLCLTIKHRERDDAEPCAAGDAPQAARPLPQTLGVTLEGTAPWNRPIKSRHSLVAQRPSPGLELGPRFFSLMVAYATWILRPEAYFSYLQYLEFKHAIETAKRAYWLSVAAIVIALLAIFVSCK